MAYIRRKKLKKQKVFKKCHFCESSTVPYYADVDVLNRFTSERGKIQGHGWTGVCSKHQRRLTREIKRARHIALLPFVA